MDGVAGWIDWDYLYGMLPLILGHLAVPPLSLLSGRDQLSDFIPPIELFLRAIYSVVPPQLLSRKFVERLLHDANENTNKFMAGDGFDWTRVTYMFVHSDFSHMLGNLQVAYMLGYPVYREWGAGGVYASFLLGGVASIWPSPLHDRQMVNFLNTLQDYVVDSMPTFITSWLPQSVTYGVSRLTSAVSSKWLELMPRNCCGSSGGVCALLGVSTVLMARDLYQMIHSDSAGSSGSVRTVKKGVLSPGQSHSYKKMILLGLNLTRTVNYLLHDVRMITISRETARKVSRQYGPLSVLTISNAGHVQGYLFGMALAVFFGSKMQQ